MSVIEQNIGESLGTLYLVIPSLTHTICAVLSATELQGVL